jgi:hypothetical protein
MSNPLDDVAKAQCDVEHSQTRLHDAVDAARSAGITWAQIGTTLNMTRQAAFKRFGKPKDPATGATMQPLPATTVKAITESTFSNIAAGDESATMSALHPEAGLAWDDIISVWKSCVGEQGDLQGFGETRVVAPGEGGPNEVSEAWKQDVALLGVSVGVTTLRQEAGELMGRVAVDPQGRVTGILVLPIDATEFPF